MITDIMLLLRKTDSINCNVLLLLYNLFIECSCGLKSNPQSTVSTCLFLCFYV